VLLRAKENLLAREETEVLIYTPHGSSRLKDSYLTMQDPTWLGSKSRSNACVTLKARIKRGHEFCVDAQRVLYNNSS
jgi:hypothetical protein